MTEPSYYPISPLKSPLEGATLDSLGPFKHDRGSSEAITTEDPPVSLPSRLRAPLRPRGFRNGSSSVRRPTWSVMKTPLEMAILPLVAIAYLAFCYTVHGRAVPVNTYGLYDVTPQHFATIKGGVTSISIIIISIALYPVYNIIADLQTEEFFRTLASHAQGIPLETINNISTPTFGNMEKMMAVWNHTCSNYYILGIVASLLIWIVATLAPGALTINNLLADGPVMAIVIGAVPPQSVLNGSYPEDPAENASLNAATAASIAWAEIELGVQYSFNVANSSDAAYTAFIAPVPLNLATTTSGRWLTDVIGINPTCSWASTNITATVQVPVNSSSDVGQYLATAYLADFNLDVQITASDLPSLESTSFATVVDPTTSVTNHSTGAAASDGSTVFILGQCASGCLSSLFVQINMDLSSVSNTFQVALTDQTWTFAILTCIPNIAIETREVRNDGHGILTVQPLPSGHKFTSQGNLNPIQTTAMFSIVTMGITQNGGALSGTRVDASSLGSEVQGDVLFGKAQFAGLPGTDAPMGTTATISPASIEDITASYTQLIQSASKSYLAGYLGTAYVPGRISASEIVFAASIPNLAVASAMFALLTALIVVAHFRPGKGSEFTLVNIAAAVHESELPALFAQGRGGAYGHAGAEGEEVYVEQGQQGSWDKDKVGPGEGHVMHEHLSVAEALRDRRVFMEKRADGSPVLHISSE